MGNVVRSRILCLGIDGAGKTAFIDKVQHPDQDIPTSPTDAYVVRDVKVKGVVLNVWDVAGRSSTRSLWKHYFAEGSTDAVIWVVDSSSSEDKLEESKQALASVLMDPNLAGVLLFVLANKQDAPGAKDPDAIAKLFNLSGQDGKRPWFIRGISARTGDGIKEAVSQLAKETKAIAKAKN